MPGSGKTTRRNRGRMECWWVEEVVIVENGARVEVADVINGAFAARP
jgi:hypothetical protein